MGSRKVRACITCAITKPCHVYMLRVDGTCTLRTQPYTALRDDAQMFADPTTHSFYAIAGGRWREMTTRRHGQNNDQRTRAYSADAMSDRCPASAPWNHRRTTWGALFNRHKQKHLTPRAAQTFRHSRLLRTDFAELSLLRARAGAVVSCPVFIVGANI